MNHASKAAVALMAALTFAVPHHVAAQGADISAIADGKAWNAQPAGGPKMSLTLNPDGTGRMKFGIMSRKVSWTPNAGGLCMTGMPGGKRCITFSPTADGYVGRSDDGRSLTLTRG
jgi:hypothetical protein